MISNSVDDSQSHPEHNEIGNDRVPAGSRRSRRGVPRWFAVVGCCVLVVWACLTLYDYQHVAAPAARRLWSLDASDRLAAIHELEGSGRVDTGVAIPALIRALKDTNTEVRTAAAMALVSAVPGVADGDSPTVVNVRAALDALVKSLNDPQPAFRAVATRALWMVFLAPDTPLSDETVTALAAILQTGDTRRRAGAAAALGRFHPTSSLFSALVGSINDQDGVVRVAVLRAIHDAEFGAPFVIPKALESALEDESPDVRVAAAAALGHAGLGDDSSVRALFRHAEHDADMRVRQMCSASLQHLRDSRKLPAAALPALPIDRHDLSERPDGR